MSAITESFAKLEPRERNLLVALGGVVAAILFLAVPVYLVRTVATARDDNQLMRDFIDKIAESRDKIDKRRAAREALLARYAKTMPALASFVEDAAQAHQVDIAESQARPDIPHGKKYVEHVLSVKLRKTGLLGLAKMLEKIEKSGYPVAITKLNVKPRAGEPDSYDVELHVSAFERKDTKKPKAEAEEPKDDEEAP